MGWIMFDEVTRPTERQFRHLIDCARRRPTSGAGTVTGHAGRWHAPRACAAVLYGAYAGGSKLARVPWDTPEGLAVHMDVPRRVREGMAPRVCHPHLGRSHLIDDAAFDEWFMAQVSVRD